MTKDQTQFKQIPMPLFMILSQFMQKEYDLDIKDFLKEANIDINAFLSSAFIPLNTINELITWVMKIKQDYKVLYKIASLSSPSRMGILGYMMMHSKNAHEALTKLCKYYLLIGKRIQPVLLEEGKECKIVIYFNDESGQLLDMSEYNAAIHLFAIVHLINQIMPNQVKPTAIHFKQNPYSYMQKNEMEGINLCFTQEENAIFFSKKSLLTQTLNADESLLKIFEKEAEETLQLKLNDSVLKEKISGLILATSSSLDISLESIASKVGVHPRVLQKELKKEQTSFSDILAEVRQKLCTYYLSKGMEMEMISLSLGYLDLSSFFRAFKKWYGMTPTQWKKLNT